MSDFETVLNEGWRDHERDMSGVAARLEEHLPLVTDGAKASRWAMLATHLVGQHLKDWPRAERICAEAARRAGTGRDAAPAWASVAVTRHLAGETAGALAAEATAATLDPGEAAALAVRVRMLLAEAWSGAGRPREAGALYEAALSLARALGAKTSVDRLVAVVSNNLASALVARGDRTVEETALMERAAAAAREFWLRVGDWTNDERADYLLAIVANVAGKPSEALAFAERGLATIARHGSEPADEACLSAALAAALRALGRDRASALARADRAVASILDPSTREWVAAEVAKAR
jgi:tetratricopeptide (TPR) repeat protein